MFSKRDTLDRIAQHQKGRWVLCLLARCGIAVEAIEGALARELEVARTANRVGTTA